MKINMIKKGMLDSEKAKLFKRITIVIGDKLSYLVSKDGGWKAREVYAHVGIPEARQSEYKNFNKYKRRISQKDLILCIGGGIVAIDELIKKCAENEKEEEYLTTLLIYENQELREILKEVQNAGFDPVEILRNALKNQK
jgi:hypothetical protein